ncbi:MAG: P1 family peptidase [Thermoplasmata archaeon]
MALRSVPFATIPGVRVGHAVDREGSTGVTVTRFDQGVPVVLDLRGGVAATYDTGSLSLESTFGRRWAIFFSGGSLYGLDAARGVRTRLLEEGIVHRAFRNPNAVLPISGAAIFDLPRHAAAIPDYLPLGYEAARSASQDPFGAGAIGAGAGATVGKYAGRRRASAGGLAAAAVRTPLGAHVGVMVVVNSVGAVRDPSSGRWVAGASTGRGRIIPPTYTARPSGARSNTTLAMVVTDLRFPRTELARMAIGVSAGLSRAIVPFATSYDGDMVFVASTERRAPRPAEDLDRVAGLAAELAVEATLRAVRSPRPVRG